MKKSAKRLLASVGSFTVGAGLIAANGVFMLTKNQPEPIVHNDPVPNAQVQPAELKLTNEYIETPIETEALAVTKVSAVELNDENKAKAKAGKSVKKARLDDYTMLLKVDKNKSEAEKAADSVYSEVYELDTTKIYDPQLEPLRFTETRSVKKEYFTVNDIISGSTVTMNAHELICQMVYNEIGGDWDADAIKAQAVAAYSYLRYTDSIDMTPEVGLRENYPSRIEKCVSAVEGQAVFYDGKIIFAVYSASSAGFSVESERIWDIYYPYLRAVVSEYDCEDPYYGLKYVFSKAQCKSIFESALGITMSDDADKWFVMDDIYSGRYVGYITIDGQKTITARQMQDILNLKNQAFTVNIDKDNVVFRTFGWGHGVGMSQWGAHYYAEHGYTYDQILRHYYLNTTVALSKESSKAVQRGAPYRTT